MPRLIISEIYPKLRSNTVKFPGILEVLADDLGVSATALDDLGVAYYPHNQSWVFPERDAKGEIIGLMERFTDGKKFMMKDLNCKRGLIYAVSKEDKVEYHPGKDNWLRVSEAMPCPICGRCDGCLVASRNPSNPAAAVCVRIAEGAVKPLDLGYLHILRQEGRVGNKTSQLSGCDDPDMPILVVEGASDTAAGLTLGLPTVGRPSAEGGMKLLGELIRGRNVIIIGDNDAGVGRKGMETAFAVLKDNNKSCIKLMPPDGLKDLRGWLNKGLTQEHFLDYAKNTGSGLVSEDVFPDDIAQTIAHEWLRQKHYEGSQLMLRNWKGGWAKFNGTCYEDQEPNIFRGQLYKFLEGKECITIGKDGPKVTKYRPTKAKVNDIIDALSQWCPTVEAPPVWLDQKERPDPLNLISFKNGILDLNEYVKGKIKLYNCTPDLFSFNALPYNFDEDSNSDLWDSFVKEIFNDDKECLDLLAQWLGYNCVPDMYYEKLMLFLGRPRSGKGTILEAMHQMLGERQCCETSFQSLTGPFGYQPLVGKLAAIMGDAKSPGPRESNSALERILHITGGDAVPVNRKGQTELPYVHLTCRFTIAMNDLPSFTDHSRALETRMNILKFPNSYLGREDRTLKIRLKEEARQGKIINFALRGLVSLRKKNDFTIPATSIPELQQFSEMTSPCTAFVKECCEISEDSGFVATKTMMYDIWRNWCTARGRHCGFKENFARWLTAAAPDTKTDRMEVSGRMEDVFIGIRLDTEKIKEYM